MASKKKTDSAKAYERLVADPKKTGYVLKLFITGTTPRSLRAVANVKKICEKHLSGSYRLEVIDLYQQPQLAQGDQIIAAPTLIKQLPLPVRRILGDMSKTDRVLVGLGLQIL